MILKEIFDVMPDGWKFLKGATTHPKGYRWIHNGLSIFDKDRKVALLKVKDYDNAN